MVNAKKEWYHRLKYQEGGTMRLLSVWIPNGDYLQGKLDVLETLYHFNDKIQVVVTCSNIQEFIEFNPIIKKFDDYHFVDKISLLDVKPLISGLYFKIIYGQDSLNLHSFDELLKTMESFVRTQKSVDLFVNDYSIRNREKIAVVSYRKNFKEDDITNWYETKGLSKKYLPVAALTFKSELINQTNSNCYNNIERGNLLLTLLTFIQSERLYYLNECVYNHNDLNIMSFDSIVIYNSTDDEHNFIDNLIAVSSFDVGPIKSRKLKSYLLNQYIMMMYAYLLKIGSEQDVDVQAIRYYVVGAIKNKELQQFLNNKSSRNLLDSLTSKNQLQKAISMHKLKDYFNLIV